MSLTQNQRDALLSQMAADIRAIRKAVEPKDDKEPKPRKKDPRRLYGGGTG